MASAAIIHSPQVTETLEQRLSVAQVMARRSAIQELMRNTMREEIDYGTIPGTQKPTLYKPGAEKICSLFQLAPRVHITDMSTPDAVRYQARVELHTASGVFCGEGVGTASSAETKYQWRAAVCREEYDATFEDRRRITYRKRRDSNNQQGFYTVMQVRTEMEDSDNTILKMAKKRAMIDAVLTVTAASDIFTQDIEDDPNAAEPGTEEGAGTGRPGPQPQPSTRKPAPQQPQTGTRKPPTPTRAAAPNGSGISPAQLNRFHAIANGAGKTSDEVKLYLYERFHLESSNELTKDIYEEACTWAANRQPASTSLNPDAEDPDDYSNGSDRF
jgi:hypothetical protein